MQFHVMTLFPEMINDGLTHSIIKRAMDKNIVTINAVNIRDYTENKHKKVDDYVYGGGAGMIMACQPIYSCYKSLELDEKARVIYLSPKGTPFNQEKAKELATLDNIVLLCGHYEGVDQRVIDEIVDEEISIGDYVLTGGELGAMVIIDAVTRLLPNAINKPESFENESFENNLLEYPQYTRPYEFMGRCVPDILLSGNHKEIEKWKLEQSLETTRQRRVDLYNKKMEV